MAKKAGPKAKAPAKKPSAAKRKASPPKAAAAETLAVEIRVLDPVVGMRYPFPDYATDGSAGMDLRACIPDDRTIHPGDTLLVKSGVAISIRDPGIVGLLASRSGLSVHSRIVLANQVGVIDSDYQGEIKIPLWNAGREPYTIRPGERIAQLLFVPVRRAELKVVEEFSEGTARGEGGFGHTGS